MRRFFGRHDARMLDLLLQRRHPVLDRFMRAITWLGEPVVVIGMAVLLLILPLPSLGQAPLRAAMALALSHLWVQLLKRTLERPRPQLPVGVISLIEPPDRFSFPSGHATAAMAMALSLAPALHPAFAVFLIVLAMLVGLSRCYLGVHYPGDVLVGWVLAALGVLLVSWLWAFTARQPV